MIVLPPGLTAEGLIRRISAMKQAARILRDAGRPLSEDLEQRCLDMELHQARLARMAEPRS